MSDPLTTEDLYGKSEASSQTTGVTEKTLEYEETPIIQPVAENIPDEKHVSVGHSDTSANADAPRLTEPHQLPREVSGTPVQPSRGSHTAVTVLVFILLFAAGIWLSSSLRQLLPTRVQDALGLPDARVTTSPSPTVRLTPTQAVFEAQWKTYSVQSGVSKKQLEGIQYSLPQSVLPPICDGAGCASQGTYLPGGTRFTVAPRGVGQSLRDYRGTAISDANGVTFTTKPVTIAGRESMEFTGKFTGRTISGYAFTTMRGVMIPLSDTVSVEFNHFIPSGITADFQKDDVLFDEIVSKISLTAAQSKGAILNTPTPTRAATVSGSPQP